MVGYTLLAIGLVITFWTLYQSYTIFTDKASAPMIFKTQVVEQKSKVNNQLDLKQQIEQRISELLPLDILPKMLNLLAWLMLAIILILGGGQIAALGIKMIK